MPNSKSWRVLRLFAAIAPLMIAGCSTSYPVSVRPDFPVIPRHIRAQTALIPLPKRGQLRTHRQKARFIARLRRAEAAKARALRYTLGAFDGARKAYGK